MLSLRFGAQFKQSLDAPTSVLPLEANIENATQYCDGLKRLMSMPGTENLVFRVSESPANKDELCLTYNDTSTGKEGSCGSVSKDQAKDRGEGAKLLKQMVSVIVENNRLLKEKLANPGAPSGETPPLLKDLAGVLGGFFSDLEAVELRNGARLKYTFW
ncbi:MAG TPA: hypothetical protein V6C52_07805 [Coleofasciculaceae cyanobacterium]|jgi:hypothetical protein